MGLPDGASMARPTDQIEILPGSTSLIPDQDGKISYAATVTNTQSTILMPTCQEQEAVIARKTTHNGIPALIFKEKDYYGVMAAECKRTIVGRFLRTRPQIERIRSQVSERFLLKGSVKIGIYDNYNVFMDFTSEEDFNMVWFRRVVEIEGRQIWMQKWSPDFKPEEDSPVAPVWALIPGVHNC